MKRFSLLIILIFLALTTVASATQTRVTTLGNVDHIIADENNIWQYPQTLSMYPDRVLIEIAGTNFNRAGMHYGGSLAESIGSIALYFNQATLSNTYAPSVPDTSGNPQTTIQQKIDLIWAKEISAVTFGAGISMYGNSYEKDYPAPGKDKTVRSASGLGISLGATLLNSIDTFFSFTSFGWTNEDPTGQTITSPEGNSIISLGGRYWMELSDSYTLIPYLGITLGGQGRSYGPGSAQDGTDSTYSYTQIMIGAGDNIIVADNVLLVSDIGLSFLPTSREYKQTGVAATTTKRSYKTLPYFRFGLEATISEKFDFRMGAQKQWFSLTNEDNIGNKDTWGYAGTSLSLGFAYHRGNLNIDAAMNPGFFTRGPFLISGAAANLASQVSVRYAWGD